VNTTTRYCRFCKRDRPLARFKLTRSKPHQQGYYPSKCRDCHNAVLRERRKVNPAPARAAVRRWIEKDPAGYIRCALQNRARKQGVPFNLTTHDIREMLASTPVCPVFGILLRRSATGRMEDDSPSFDRELAAAGYVRGNVTVISWRANHLKNNATATELRQIADWMDRRPLQ
jgi:hypothetical protein